MKFTKEERQRIRLWLEKSPKTDDKVKELTLQREDGTSVTLTRTTNYYGKWKVRIALERETQFPICMSGPIHSSSDSKGPTNKPKWTFVPKLPKPESAEVPTPKGALTEEQMNKILKEVYAPAMAYQLQDSVVFNTIPMDYDDHDQPPVKKKATKKGAFKKAVAAEMAIIKKAMKDEA